MRFRFKYKNLLLLSILSVLLLSLFISPMIQADGKTTVSNADASVIDESTIAVSVAFNSAEHNNSRLLNSKARNLSLSDLNRLLAEQFDGDFKDANPRDSEKEFIRKKNGCGEASKFRQQEDNWQITNIILNIPGEGCSDILNELDIVVALRNQENFDIEAAEGEEDGNSCEAQGKLSWLLCPVIQAMDSALNWVDTQIERLLLIEEGFYRNDGLQDAASSIRNIAYIILVPITLVMVIGTAIGVNAFDAYTVKKALPRMAIATVFIGLSYQIGAFLIELFNSIGQGTLGLMTLPFGDETNLSLNNLFGPGTGSAGVLQTIFGIPAVVAFGIGAVLVLWFFGTTILLFTGIAFVVLMLRQLFVVALLLIAPLAILAWIFPGNDKLWKSWWSIYSKLLIMFPLIMGLLAIGRIFAYLIVGAEEDSSALSGGVLEPFAKLAAYILPYAFIPFTFKFAGGVFATVSGAMNDKSRGIFDRQKKTRAGKLDRMRNQKTFKAANPETRIGRMKGRINTAGTVVTNPARLGANPRNWRDNMGGLITDNTLLQAEAIAEDKENTIKGDDDLSRAIADTDDSTSLRDNLLARDRVAQAADRDRNDGRITTRYLGRPDGEANLGRDVARAEKMRKKYGTKALQIAAWKQAAAGGTAYTQNADAWVAAARISGDNSAYLADMVGKGRTPMINAGRADSGGAGFGDTMEIARRTREGWYDPNHVNDDGSQGRHYTGAQYVNEGLHNKHMRQAVYRSQGPQVLTHPSMKPISVNNMIPEMLERIEAAEASGSQDLVDRELAFVDSVYSTLKGTSPQLAALVADQVMNWRPAGNAAQQNLAPGIAGPVAPGGGMTILEMVEDRRNQSEVFASTSYQFQGILNQPSPQNRGTVPPPGQNPPPTTPGSGAQQPPPTAL